MTNEAIEGYIRTEWTCDSSGCTQGVFLVKMKHVFEPVKRDNSMNTYTRISTVPPGSERSEWAVRANERMDERVAQYLRLYFCLFQTTVQATFKLCQS